MVVLDIPRFCSHSHLRSEGAGKHREGEIVAGELVVTSGDATKMFDAIEKAFDDVPSSIQYTAIATLGLSIRARRNNCLRTRGADGVSLSETLCVRHKLAAKEPLLCHANARKK